MTAKIERKPARELASIASIAVVMGLLAGPAAAQTATSTTGVVSGVVSDATGGVLPGVTVLLTDLNTSAARETVTSESGHYSFANVLPGRYRLVATLAGFQQTIVPEIAVEVNKSQSVDLKLGVGRVTEAVEVRGGAAAVLQLNAANFIVFNN